MDRLITEQFNAISFSLLGMGIVFTGLAIIAIYISLFPWLLRLFSHQAGVSSMESNSRLSEQELESEELLAIMVAFRLHNLSGADDQLVTWKRHRGPKSSWDISRRADTIRRM